MQAYQLANRVTTANAPLNGGKAYFYLTTTTTLEDVFEDAALGTPLSNPVVANSAGFFPELVYLDPTKTYRLVLKTSAGATIFDADPINTAEGGTGIETADIADGAVTAPKMADGAIEAKLGYTPADDADVTALQTLTGALTGSVTAFAMSTAPTGWLECDGASVLRSAYPALFTAIGTTWGSVDGTHFTLPDLRGEFIRGWDNGKGTDSARAFASSQADELEAHTHTYASTRSDIGSGGQTVSSGAGSGQTTGSTGGTETRPRNIALMYCIKT